MMLRRSLAFVVLLGSAWTTGRGQDAAASATAPSPIDNMRLQYANGIVAQAEDKIITVADVMRKIGPFLDQVRRSAKDERDYAAQVEKLQDDAIQELIDEVLIIKEFRKDENRRIPASYIDNAVADDLTERFDNDRSKFLAYLRSRGQTKIDYRREKEEEIILSYMQGQQRKSQSVVSPVRIETYYDENKDRFYREDEIHLRMIELKRTEGETDATLMAAANRILDRFRAGESFADLAREYTQGSNKSKGGDWDWMQRSSFRPEFGDTAFALKKGDASAPIILPEGCYILYAEDRHYAGIQPLDEVRDQIERILVQQMSRTGQERWLERLRRNGYVKHY